MNLRPKCVPVHAQYHTGEPDDRPLRRVSPSTGPHRTTNPCRARRAYRTRPPARPARGLSARPLCTPCPWVPAQLGVRRSGRRWRPQSAVAPRIVNAEPVVPLVQVLVAGCGVHRDGRSGDHAGRVEHPGNRVHDRRVPGWRDIDRQPHAKLARFHMLNAACTKRATPSPRSGGHGLTSPWSGCLSPSARSNQGNTSWPLGYHVEPVKLTRPRPRD